MNFDEVWLFGLLRVRLQRVRQTTYEALSRAQLRHNCVYINHHIAAATTLSV